MILRWVHGLINRELSFPCLRNTHLIRIDVQHAALIPMLALVMQVISSYRFLYIMSLSWTKCFDSYARNVSTAVILRCILQRSI